MLVFQEAIARGCPAIPVLLKNASDITVVPKLLAARQWPNMRLEVPDPFEQLVWGITGSRPRQVLIEDLR